MSTENHPILGEKIDYNKLNPKQQESYNLQRISSIFAEYGYLVIKLSDDWNDADFIALEFGKDNYLKVQLKGRFGFFKKYLGKNLSICFCDQYSNSWYLYPHDELCEIIMKKHGDTVSWKDKGEFHFPTISEDDKEILRKYKITEETQKEILEDSQKDYSSDSFKEEIEKIERKSNRWFLNMDQINSKILYAFIRLYKQNNGTVTYEQLKKEANIPTFKENFDQMKNIGEKNHGKIFEQNGQNIYLWKEVEDIILKKAKEIGFDIIKQEMNHV